MLQAHFDIKYYLMSSIGKRKYQFQETTIDFFICKEMLNQGKRLSYQTNFIFSCRNQFIAPVLKVPIAWPQK